MTPRWWRQATPFGDIIVVTSAVGINRVVLSMPAVDEPPGAPRRDRAVAAQFDAWCAGTRHVIDVSIDLEASDLSEFQVHALRTLRAEVPWGETVTYGELAELAGRPGAARAIGTAMARNPVPFVIPCHRVVAANGIGGYGGGTAGIALKRRLLAREGPVRPSA